jgi:general stress protein 26
MTDQEKFINFLAQSRHMVLAVTLEDGRPWAVPLKVQEHGSDFVEWDSRTDTLHSQAIERDPRVMLLMYSTTKDDQVGVYMQAAVTDTTMKGEYARYRATIERTWLNDETFQKREVTL